MANNAFRLGLWPEPENPMLQNITMRVPVLDSGRGAALFINSPVVLTSGYAVDVGTATGSKITGTVELLYDSTGLPVACLPTTSTGSAEITYKSGQKYRIRVSGTQFGGNADVGKFYSLTAEAAVVQTATNPGDTVSSRKIDGSTESASVGPLQVTSVGPEIFDNATGVTNIDVVVTLNPTNYVAAN